MIRIVTTFSQAQWDDYVHRILPRNIELWPAEWQVWLDDRESLPGLEGLPVTVDDRYLCDDDRHENFMEAWGGLLLNNQKLDSAITENRYPVNYTQDAGVFCHKVFAMCNGAARQNVDWLIFLGSDVEIFEPITEDWLEGILKGDIVHLGRKDIRASETDFLAFRVGNDVFSPANRFLNAFRYIYTTGDVFKYAEFTDAHVLGRMAVMAEGLGFAVHDLSKGVSGLNVWEHTRLAERMTHHKGPAGKMELMA